MLQAALAVIFTPSQLFPFSLISYLVIPSLDQAYTNQVSQSVGLPVDNDTTCTLEYSLDALAADVSTGRIDSSELLP